MHHPLNVFVIVLNYNGATTLNACLASIFQSVWTPTTLLRLHVVVVDNASTDNSFEAARQRFDNVEYIKNSNNVGFAAGNNVGIRFALERDADYVILVNHDARLHSDTIAQLIHADIKHKKPSILCPQIFTPSGKIWYAGAEIDWYRMRIVHRHTQLHGTAIIPTQSATGCILSIHKDVFASIGLLNESYFLYYEDADFSFCAHKHGYDVGVVPTAMAIHHEVSEQDAHKPKKTYWLVLSALLFFSAHAPWYYQWIYAIAYPIRKIKNAIMPRDPLLAPNVADALKDFPQAKKHYVHHC